MLNGTICAEVAELADAQDLGSCGRKAVGVQLPPSAPARVSASSIQKSGNIDALGSFPYTHLSHPAGALFRTRLRQSNKGSADMASARSPRQLTSRIAPRGKYAC